MGLPAFQTEEVVYGSPEDYLRLEREAEYKHEYYQGEIRAIEKGDINHTRLRFNLLHLLFAQLHGKPCRPTFTERVYIENKSSFLYANVSVACGKPKFLQHWPPDTLLNPTLLLDVVGTPSIKMDWGSRFEIYRQLPSLNQYLVLDAQQLRAELYSRDAQGNWLLSDARSPSDVLNLSSIDCQVPLAELYVGVALTGEP